jgi:hypothetical protein
MKKSSLLKIFGAILIVASAFFTPVTSVVKARQRYCVPAGQPCPGPLTPFRCCGFCLGLVCGQLPFGPEQSQGE